MPPTSDPISVVGRINHAVEDRLPPHFLLDVWDDAAVEAGLGEQLCDRRRLLVRFKQRVACDGVVDDAGPDEHAADLGDGAQHQRAVADEILHEVFGIKAILHAHDGDVRRQQRHDRLHARDVVVDLGGQQDQRARLD
jgi:hypothetical protein